MKQTASHSQTPTFVKNESNTKPVLYQHPTPAEMRTPRLAIIKANLKDFGIFALTALVLWFVIRKDQGAKSILKILDETYDCDIVKKDKGFYIMRAKIY